MYHDLFESQCFYKIAIQQFEKKCTSRLLWDPYFGLLPPLYRDYLLRFDRNIMHNSCYSIQRSI